MLMRLFSALTRGITGFVRLSISLTSFKKALVGGGDLVTRGRVGLVSFS